MQQPAKASPTPCGVGRVSSSGKPADVTLETVPRAAVAMPMTSTQPVEASSTEVGTRISTENVHGAGSAVVLNREAAIDNGGPCKEHVAL